MKREKFLKILGIMAVAPVAIAKGFEGDGGVSIDSNGDHSWYEEQERRHLYPKTVGQSYEGELFEGDVVSTGPPKSEYYYIKAVMSDGSCMGQSMVTKEYELIVPPYYKVGYELKS